MSEKGCIEQGELYYQLKNIVIISLPIEFKDGDILKKIGDKWYHRGQEINLDYKEKTNYLEWVIDKIETATEEIKESRKFLSKQMKALKKLKEVINEHKKPR